MVVEYVTGWLARLSQTECRPIEYRMKHVYEIRPRKDERGFDLISDALPFGGLWYAGPNAVANANRVCAALQPLPSRCDPHLR